MEVWFTTTKARQWLKQPFICINICINNVLSLGRTTLKIYLIKQKCKQWSAWGLAGSHSCTPTHPRKLLPRHGLTHPLTEQHYRWCYTKSHSNSIRRLYNNSSILLICFTFVCLTTSAFLFVYLWYRTLAIRIRIAQYGSNLVFVTLVWRFWFLSIHTFINRRI